MNKEYLKRGKLGVVTLGRGTAWLDTGTHESLLQASVFIETLQNRQGLIVACPEEIAFRERWIGADELERMAATMKNSAYGKYLADLVLSPLS